MDFNFSLWGLLYGMKIQFSKHNFEFRSLNKMPFYVVWRFSNHFLLDCFRSSHRRCSTKNVALKNFAKFPGKHLCWSLSFKKVAGLRPATLLKERLHQRCFPLNFANFFRTAFSQNTSGRLLLLFWFWNIFLRLLRLIMVS